MRPASRIFFYALVAYTFLFTTASLAQQTVKDSSFRALAIHSAIHEYQDFISFAAPLYSGQEYVEYYLQVQEGQPFFSTLLFI